MTTDEVKERFYDDLDSTFPATSCTDKLFLLGNLMPELVQATRPGKE